MGKIRLFIALDLSAKARKKVYKLCDNIKGIRWTKRGQLHLTLSFIGEIDAEMIPQLSGALSRINFSSFDLTLSGTGYLRSNIFFLELDESAALISLKKQIDDVLHQVLEREFDSRNFIPHITLARFKRRLSPTKLKILTQSFAPILPESFAVDKFVLYSSKISMYGAVHTPLKVISARKI